ncbi:MAG: biopolymer transporter ExbD [Thermoanaerobaculia bacterium]
MKIRRINFASAYIPTASMADIVFLLIIFFILTFNTDVDRASRVSLPKSMEREEVPKKAALVSIDKDRVIRISDGEETSKAVGRPEDVLSFAANIVATQPGKPIVVKADKDLPYKVVDNVIDQLKQARVSIIYLLTEQRTVDAK